MLLTSQGHYSCTKGCGFLGLGTDSLFKVATDAQGCMDPVQLEKRVQEARDRVTGFVLPGFCTSYMAVCVCFVLYYCVCLIYAHIYASCS